MGNRTFTSEAKAVAVATAITLSMMCASAPVVANASTTSASYDAFENDRFVEFVGADFGGYIDKVNDAVSTNNVKTAKEVFEICEPDAVTNVWTPNYGGPAGDDWHFDITVGDDFRLDFISGSVATGGYATGATVDVFKLEGDEVVPMITVERNHDSIQFGSDYSLDLAKIESTTEPFILTGSSNGGVAMVAPSDMALICALYECCVANAETDPPEADPEEQPTVDPSIGALYWKIAEEGQLADYFLAARNEANNGVANGWEYLSDASSLIPECGGQCVWSSGLWTVRVVGQDPTNIGLSQGFVEVRPIIENGEGSIRFFFSPGCGITMTMMSGDVAVRDYTTDAIEDPTRYGVIDFESGVMDTELLALTAVVSHYCATAARG